MIIGWGVVVCWFSVYELPFCHVRYSGLATLPAVACKVSWLSAVEAVSLEWAMLLWLGQLLGLYDAMIGV
jgi:hypothetical protein